MPVTAQQLADLSRKIFQRLPQNHTRSGNKVISQQLKGAKVASWFHKPLALAFGGRDPVVMQDNKERIDRLEQLKRRGKTTPKKGAGKRSGKK